ncbi:MAG: glycoside hydrolase family 9 protein [Fibrobacter sp.]|nr:glycoside hydrolase family 9 protein [Fibrobacter sp.]
MTKLTKILIGSFILGLLFADLAMARDLPNIDRTDKVHDRRYLDSMNVFHRRSIRVNQSGFRPQDYKYAYVADPGTNKTFKVVNVNTQKEVYSGQLNEIFRNIAKKVANGQDSIIVYTPAKITKPGMWVNGAFNSISSVYEFNFYSDTTVAGTERLFRAEFTDLTTIGEYYVIVGNDTSAVFNIHPSIYNAILEYALQFFGAQRCGNTKSHFHGACHLKDGSKVGHDLTGGWHDCGDHFKVSETLGYSAYVLSMVYLTYQDKAEDIYGNSYADTVFTDGIPDILYEAKIGTDFILKLYEASKADNLIAKGDMYHSVGVAGDDHNYWDLPERQDAQAPAQGGPDRAVLSSAGADVVGMYIAALANVAVGYEPFDPVYSDSLLTAAKDLYKNVMWPAYKEGRNTAFPGFYTGTGVKYDDCAAAALALWYATKDTTYRYDLYKNKSIFDNTNNVKYNLDYFPAGFLGIPSGFTPGGWATDYQNIHAYVLFGLEKLILGDKTKAIDTYGLSETERDSLEIRTMATFRKLIDNATNAGDSLVLTNPAIEGTVHQGPTNLHVISPYNLVWTSFDWGVIRYNLGSTISVFLMYELTKDERYLKVSLDNMYYALGANPWDMSFLMGAGEKNEQHPHNRAANPDGYNAGSMPYEYRCPRGALMGGREPNLPLIEDWSKYTSTETCIDFSAQFLFPAQSLAETLPVDAEGPLYSNIAGTPITDTSAIISWDANEVALTTVFYNTTPDASSAKSVQQTKASKGGAITIEGLVTGQTYYFFLEGMDTKRNMTTDDNHGQWYQFTMTPAATSISGVTICQVDHRSAKIYWWSSDRMNGIVNYGNSASAMTEEQAAEGGAVMFHEAKLTNLKPGTTYYFSVSSGTTTDDNNGKGYSFTTEEYASTVDMDIYMKPLNKNGCTNSSDWKQCNTFLVIVTNNDTMDYKDLDLRFYFPVSVSGISDNRSIWDGTGQSVGRPEMTFDTPVAYNVTTAKGTQESGYYTNVHIEGELKVSGSYFFEFKVNPSFGSLENSWSLRPHTDPDDPEQFPGIDLTKGPKYVEESNSNMYIETINGKKEVAYTRTPYITAYYHGKYIYGYGPDYTPENGPQMNRTVKLSFTSPFVSPRYSIETVDSNTIYAGGSRVSPTGILDDFEMNGNSIVDFVEYPLAGRRDSFEFSFPTVSVYGNNYYEWVSWHNHAANLNGSFDCACDVIRSNVEIDTITTPPEQRHLVFTVDTVQLYTGKMAEVHVQLLDSTFALLDAEPINVLLSTESGLAQFFASPTATTTIDRIDIIHGEAVFYISSDKPTTTTLYAIGNNTAKFNYTPATAPLIIEDLPPWPIIDVARMIDMDCNGVPDAFNILLSNEYVSELKQSFNSIKYVYNGDTLTSSKVISQDGKFLVVAADIKDSAINTTPVGYISLLSNTNEGIKASEDFYQDGIAPVLQSVSVLERLKSATSDKVYLQFSEPIVTPNKTWPIKLFPNDNAITVNDIKLYNDSLNIWEYDIAFDAGGASLITEGMEAQLLSTSGIKDEAGNTIGECTPAKLPVLLKLLPIPMEYASISDLDENGLAEHLDIIFTQEVDQKHIPNQVSIIFGSANPETLWVAGTSLSFDAAKTSASINLEPAFTLGNTNGPYEGDVYGKSLVGAGKVIQHLGTGAAYESNSVLAEDKVGPVFVSAALQSSALTALTLEPSEPIKIADSTRTLFLRERDDVAFNRYNVYKWTFKPTALTFIDTSAQFIMEGDRARFAPHVQSAFTDLNGNQPATDNPWVTIGGEGTPKITFNVDMKEHLVKVNPATATATTNDPSIRMFIYNDQTHAFDLIDSKTGKVVKFGIDTTKTPFNGAVWAFDLSVPRGAAFNEPAAWSTLKFKYDIPIYTNLGTFVNRISGTYDITPEKYLTSKNKVSIFVEWTNTQGVGLRSQEGKAVGTGAYIYKAEIQTQFTPNPSTTEENKTRYNSRDSYDKTKIFGIKRTTAAK